MIRSGVGRAAIVVASLTGVALASVTGVALALGGTSGITGTTGTNGTTGAGSASGTLTQLPAAKGCWSFRPAAGCSVYDASKLTPRGATPNLVATALSADGQNLYVAANNYTNLIVGFVRAADGSLVPIKGRGGCVLPLTTACEPPAYRQRQLSGLAVGPEGSNVYTLADYRYVEGVQALIRVAGGGLRGPQAGVTCAGGTAVDATDRRNDCRYTLSLGAGPRALQFGPKREIYVAAGDGVVTLGRTASGGVYLEGCLGRTVAPSRGVTCGPARGATHAAGVAVSPDGRDVYVSSAAGVAVFARDARTGALTQLAGTDGCVDDTGAGGCAVGRALARPSDPTRSGGSRLVMSRDGQNVYLAAADGIATFARNPATGALTQLAGPAGCTTQMAHDGCAVGRSLAGIEALRVSPDGLSVYAAAYTSRGLAVLRRTPSTGALVQPGGRVGCLNGDGRGGCAVVRGVGAADAVSVARDSRTVYVGSFDTGLAVFHRA